MDHMSWYHLFQSTLPQGERQIIEGIIDGIKDFNPRSHKGSDRNSRQYRQGIYIFQSTLPQGERQKTTKVQKEAAYISIHAPTRGATARQKWYRRCPRYFNPRSHKGSDKQREVVSVDNELFQSTLPQGERPNDTATYTDAQLISIHAPTRGATERPGKPDWCPVFQSTLPQGERQQFYTKFHICFISFLPILSPYHISTHSPLPTFNHFLYIFSGANRPEISCLLPFRTKTISGIL